MAIEDVNESKLLPSGWNLQFVAANTGVSTQKNETQEQAFSSAAVTIQKMTQMRDFGVASFIGPDKTCTSEALVAAAWNLPMISYVSKVLEIVILKIFY